MEFNELEEYLMPLEANLQYLGKEEEAMVVCALVELAKHHGIDTRNKLFEFLSKEKAKGATHETQI